MTAVECHGERLLLLAGRGVFWPGGEALFIADPHFGKTAAFRASGLAAPDQTAADLDRIDAMLGETGAARLVVLGDLLHARSGNTRDVVERFAAWRGVQRSLDIVLVRGNHDRSAGDPPTAWDIEIVDPGHRLGPFALHHEPRETGSASAGFALAGHIHPALRFDDGTGRGTRLPAFIWGPDQLILPALGSFTGAACITPGEGERAFVIADGRVLPAPRSPLQ